MGILNVATYVTVDGQYVNVLEMNQYQNKIRFLQLTGTSGTLTSQQINLLRSDNTNYIIVDNELYNCNDLQDSNGYLVYTHTGADTSNNVNIKTLSITLTNNNWSIQTTPVQPKIPVANTNEAVQFAEDERQKSKNLLLVVDSSATVHDYTMTCKDGVFTINGGNGTDETTFILSGTGGVKSTPTKYYQSITLNTTNSIKLNAGTYTISATIPSALMGILYGDLGTTSQSGASHISFDINRTLTFTKTTYVCIYRYLSGSAMTNVSLGSLQIEEGSVATDYQPYNGEIVHEKDIADVEHIETIYNKSSNDTNINWGYTGGIQDEVSITNKDFSKYKYLKCYIVNEDAGKYAQTMIAVVDLTTLFNNYYRGASTIETVYTGKSISTELISIQNINAYIDVNVNKNTIYVTLKVHTNGSEVSVNNYTYVYKIEGVY